MLFLIAPYCFRGIERTNKKLPEEIVGTKNLNNRFQEHIFKSLNLTENERKFISISKHEELIYFSFPLKQLKLFRIDYWPTDKELTNDFNGKVIEFMDEQLSKGGFSNIIGYSTILSNTQIYYKEVSDHKDILQAVGWLVEFKKRIGLI